MSDLIENLRTKADWFTTNTNNPIDGILAEAADRIEQLEREKKELVATLANCRHNATKLRMWAGMDWHYQSPYAQRIHDEADSILAKHADQAQKKE